MNILVRRNIKLYFRDRSVVLFSLLAIFIIIGLYAFFLGNVWGDSTTRALPGADILKYSWLIAGILAVATITTSMGAFGVIVDDKVKKINKDFYASPVKRRSITSGYILSAWIVSVIMSMITLIAAEIYIAAQGGTLLSVPDCIKVIGLIFIAGFSNTAMICFIISLLKSHSTFSTASTILGTLIGFLTGIYLPIGALPEAVQTIIKLFPPSHAAVLLRQVMMEVPMQTAFKDIPAEHLQEFKEAMGVVYRFGGHEISPFESILVLLLSTVLFYILSLLNLRKTGKQ